MKECPIGRIPASCIPDMVMVIVADIHVFVSDRRCERCRKQGHEMVPSGFHIFHSNVWKSTVGIGKFIVRTSGPEGSWGDVYLPSTDKMKKGCLSL